MSTNDKSSLPPELQEVAWRLERARPQASDLELDRIKLKAMAGSSRRARAHGRGARVLIRSGRLASMVLTSAVLIAGAAVVTSNGGFSSGSSPWSAAAKQYCPPTSPGGGKPKPPTPPGNKCGKPPP